MGIGELIVVFIVVLIVLGPDKIPETAQTLGRWFYELKHSFDDVKNTLNSEIKKPTKNIIQNTLLKEEPNSEIIVDLEDKKIK